MPVRGFARSHSQRQVGYQSAGPLYQLAGLNEDENPLALRPDQLRKANNCARKGSMTGTRPCVAYPGGDYAAALAAGTPICGIHQYSTDRGASTYRLLTISNGNVYIDDDVANILDKATNSIEITGGQNFLWTIADFQDQVWATGGDIDGTDHIWYWDGTNPLGRLNLGLAENPRYIFEKWNFLFLGGLNGTAVDDNPMLARYCNYGADATDSLNWPSANSLPGNLLNENFGVGSYGSEYNTGFGSFGGPDSDHLLFLTNKRIFAYHPNPNMQGSSSAFALADTIPIGCVGQDAYVDLGVDVGDAVFLSSNGVHSVSQSLQYGDRLSAYLSWPIRRTWDTINRSRLQYAQGAYWPTEGMVLFAVSTGSNTHHNLILCLDIKGVDRLTPDNVRWYKWELNGMDVNKLQVARGPDDKPYVYVGGLLGEVTRFDRDAYADLATGGPSVEIQTRDEDYGLPSREKGLGDLFVALQGKGNYRIQYTSILDDGQTPGQSSLLEVPDVGGVWGDSWGALQWGTTNVTQRQRVPNVGDSVTIGHKFSHAGANEPFWLGVIDQQVSVSGPTDDAEANTVG